MTPFRSLSCAAAIFASLTVTQVKAGESQTDLASPLLTVSSETLPAHLRDSVAALTPDESVWKSMEASQFIRLTGVPLGTRHSATLLLHKIEPLSSDAVIIGSQLNAKGTLASVALPRPRGQWWSGIVEGKPDSKVMLSRSAAGILGLVQDEHGTTVITSDRPGSRGPIVSYLLGELPPGTINWEPFSCEELANPGEVEVGGHGAGLLVQPCRQLRIAVETDAEFLQTFAGAADPTAAATAYAATLFAGVNTIYQADLQILPQVNFLRLWLSAEDPWTQTGTANQLYELRDWWVANMSAQPRDLVAMISTRGLGGGVAWLNAACGGYGYSVSANLSGSFPYPLLNNSGQNWDIMVTAHELGHNVGSTHTHNFCPVTGDNCPPAAYFGSCQTEQVCINTGTIMSYCHLCSGGTANILLNFHPLSIDAIASYMTSSCNTVAGATPAVAVDDLFVALQGITPQLDPLANDVVVNCETISLDSFDPVSAAGATLTRVVGAGANGRDLIRYNAPANFTGVDSFRYRVREASGSTSLQSRVEVRVTPLRQPENPIGDLPGLAVSYFVLSAPSVLPEFSTLTPYLTSAITQVNYASTNGNFATSGRADDVGAVWTGWVKVDEPGIYTFFINSDDGSRLKVGNTAVVTNDGLHGMVERSGTIALAPGRHAITIEFFEAGGGAGCIASLEGPSLARAAIASTRLSRGGAVNRADINRDGRVNGLDIGLLLGAWGATSSGSDVNQDGVVSGADLGLLLAAWTG